MGLGSNRIFDNPAFNATCEAYKYGLDYSWRYLMIDERRELSVLESKLSRPETRLTQRKEFTDQTLKLDENDVFVNCVFSRCTFDGEGDIGRFCILTDCDRIPFRHPQKCILTKSASKEHVPN